MNSSVLAGLAFVHGTSRTACSGCASGTTSTRSTASSSRRLLSRSTRALNARECVRLGIVAEPVPWTCSDRPSRSAAQRTATTPPDHVHRSSCSSTSCARCRSSRVGSTRRIVDRDGTGLGPQLSFQFLETHAGMTRPSTEALAASAGRRGPGQGGRRSALPTRGRPSSGSFSRSQTNGSGRQAECLVQPLRQDHAEPAGQRLARKSQDVADRPQAQGFQPLEDASAGNRNAATGRPDKAAVFIPRGTTASGRGMSERPGRSHGAGQGKLDLKASPRQ